VPALSEPLKAEGGTWVSAKARIMILDFKLSPCYECCILSFG